MENTLLDSPVPERMHGEVSSREIHGSQASPKPVHIYQLLHRHELPQGRGNLEDRGVLLNVFGPLHAGEGLQGENREEPGVRRGDKRDDVVVLAKLIRLGHHDGEEDAVLDLVNVPPLEHVPRVKIVVVLRHDVARAEHGLEKDEC